MNPSLDPVATGHKLCNIASNLRGQAALSRERCERDIFSCLLDGLADELTDMAAPMFDTRLKLISEDSAQTDFDDADEGRPFLDLEEYAAAPGAMCISVKAKVLGVRPRTLVARLIEMGWIYRAKHHRLKVREDVIARGLMQKNCRITPIGSIEIAKAMGMDPNVLIRGSE